MSRFPAVPTASTDVVSLRNAAEAVKETVEIMKGVRGDRSMSSVTWQDLVDLQLILPSQVPTTPSNR